MYQKYYHIMNSHWQEKIVPDEKMYAFFYMAYFTGFFLVFLITSFYLIFKIIMILL